MSKSLLVYVNGHGFGHARRTACVLAALRRLAPDVSVVVRSNAPAHLFGDVRVQPTAIEPRVVERDAWTIDADATAAAVIALHDRRAAAVAEEVGAVRGLRPALVLADVPYLAADVAEAIGAPCVGSGNFTWDWIFGPLLAGHARGAEVLGDIARSYGRMTAMLRHPFSHAMPGFGTVVDIPAVARARSVDREEASCRLKIDLTDERPRVLLAMRGGTPVQTLIDGARDAPHVLFHTLQELPIGGPENLRQVDVAGLDFVDAMAAHDAVLSKLGYGLVCDALAAGTRLLWPRRVGFREDELFEREATTLLPMREIDRADYARGRWRAAIDALLAASPGGGARTDGAEVAARYLAGRLA